MKYLLLIIIVLFIGCGKNKSNNYFLSPYDISVNEPSIDSNYDNHNGIYISKFYDKMDKFGYDFNNDGIVDTFMILKSECRDCLSDDSNKFNCNLLVIYSRDKNNKIIFKKIYRNFISNIARNIMFEEFNTKDNQLIFTRLYGNMNAVHTQVFIDYINNNFIINKIIIENGIGSSIDTNTFIFEQKPLLLDKITTQYLDSLMGNNKSE